MTKRQIYKQLEKLWRISFDMDTCVARHIQQAMFVLWDELNEEEK